MLGNFVEISITNDGKILIENNYVRQQFEQKVEIIVKNCNEFYVTEG